jgi:hypothetical protein
MAEQVALTSIMLALKDSNSRRQGSRKGRNCNAWCGNGKKWSGQGKGIKNSQLKTLQMMSLQGLSLMKRLIDFCPGYFVKCALLALVPAK